MSNDEDELHQGPLGRVGRWVGLGLFLVVWLAPVPAAWGLPAAAQRTAAVTVLMGVFWVTQAMPYAVTSLLPFVLFPLMGIQSSRKVGGAYFSDSSFLYLGGFILALAVEHWGLHRRFAFGVLWLLGASRRGILLGFLFATGFLSMWISNTAATLLMIPIAIATIRVLEESDDDFETHRASHNQFAAMLLMSVAYAASIGGTATLVGTPTNIAYVDLFRRLFPDGPTVGAGQWMATWVPFAAVFLLLAWVVLGWNLGRFGPSRVDRAFFGDQYRRLGPLSQGEWRTLIVFTVTALLWVFRTDFGVSDIPIIPGWSRCLGPWLAACGVADKELQDFANDGTVAIAASLLLFIIPAGRNERGEVEYLMTWGATARIPWGVLLLFGGGFAIADAFSQTGLSMWIGKTFAAQAQGWSPMALVLMISLMMIFLTEFTSNVATVNAFLPILASISIALQIDPRLLMMPATVCASCGFMMPVGTPPNAIAFGTGRIPMRHMMSYGLVLNLVGVILCQFVVFWLLVPQQAIDPANMPKWAISVPK